MLNLVIFGAPGSGKGTQGAMLAQRHGLKHISTGEVLRRHIAEGTPLGRTADSYISQGNLIPDELMIDVLADVLDHQGADAKGVIFDGFPRTIPQARALNRILAQRGETLDGVIGLEVPQDELIDRMLKRGQQTGRADDTAQTIANRLDVYHRQTQPLKEYYQTAGLYHEIPGSGDLDTIAKAIDKALGK